MNVCPKCSCARIDGPSYFRAYGMEWLNYRCSRCGYEESGPTHDREKPAPTVATSCPTNEQDV